MKKSRIPEEIALQVLGHALLSFPDCKVESANIVDTESMRIFFRDKQNVLFSKLFPWIRKDNKLETHISRADSLTKNLDNRGKNNDIIDLEVIEPKLETPNSKLFEEIR